ncbi:putative protein OS=Streptomyces aurantiogriseus OX=66870 GN=GCM10010251_92880 PE=4 SV=1 [Streptomyces aurantiogriseus]|uniref:Uncharacterized protein n=1 Tax=Streptomyces aurantiogriseus TaxID=66870 RepID=A0A918FNX4_9ACTN|nr:hypothetical protein GCM10010251_92880 [Streptomyces aurantiogriseus]
MAKESGLGWSTCSIDDSSGTARAIVNDFTNISFATPRGVQDVTGIDKSAYERLLLLADATFEGTGVFNDASNMSHDVFKTVSSTSVQRTVTLTVSGQTLANEMIFTDYPLTRAASGELTFTVPGQLANGSVPTWA